MRFLFLFSLWFLCAPGLSVQAQEAIYIIRHAEKELTGEDPKLTDIGRKRAAAWAEMLMHAKLDVAITSDARRTRETGEIIAKTLGLPKKEIPKQDVTGLVDLLQFDHEEDSVLVVGHTETIPNILAKLGVVDVVEISKDDFANLFILFAPGSGERQLVRLRMPQAIP